MIMFWAHGRRNAWLITWLVGCLVGRLVSPCWQQDEFRPSWNDRAGNHCWNLMVLQVLTGDSGLLYKFHWRGESCRLTVSCSLLIDSFLGDLVSTAVSKSLLVWWWIYLIAPRNLWATRISPKKWKHQGPLKRMLCWQWFVWHIGNVDLHQLRDWIADLYLFVSICFIAAGI